MREKYSCRENKKEERERRRERQVNMALTKSTRTTSSESQIFFRVQTRGKSPLNVFFR